VVNVEFEFEGLSAGFSVVPDVWSSPGLVFVVCEGYDDVGGLDDVYPVECVCVVVCKRVVEYDDTVLVCTDGGDAVDVVVAIPVGIWVVDARVSIRSLHVIINSWSYVPVCTVVQLQHVGLSITEGHLYRNEFSSVHISMHFIFPNKNHLSTFVQENLEYINAP